MTRHPCHYSRTRTLVLAALRVCQPATVRQVCDTLQDVAGVSSCTGSVYQALRRLEREGLVTAEGVRPCGYRLVNAGNEKPGTS